MIAAGQAEPAEPAEPAEEVREKRPAKNTADKRAAARETRAKPGSREA